MRPQETAYPRIKNNLSEKEIVSIYTPTQAELLFVEKYANRASSKLRMLVILKTSQRLGYFLRISDTPSAIVMHIAKSIGLDAIPKRLDGYDDSSTKRRHITLILIFLSITGYSEVTNKFIREKALEAARTKQEISDIINSVLEELVTHRFELPAFSTLLRAANAARSQINRQCYETIVFLLSPKEKAIINGILKKTATVDSKWNFLKQEPKKPTLKNIREFLKHLHWLQSIDLNFEIFDKIPAVKVEQFYLEARALNVAQINLLKENKRIALAAIFIRYQTARALDDIAEIFIKTMRQLKNRAKEALKAYHLSHVNQTNELIGVLRDLIQAYRIEGSSDEKITAINEVFVEDLDSISEKCDVHLAYAGDNFYPFLLKFYHSKRSVLLECIQNLEIYSSTTDDSIVKAIEFLLLNKDGRSKFIALGDCDLDLNWIPKKWYKLVTGGVGKDKAPVQLSRKHFEIFLLMEVMQELNCGDLYIKSSDAYRDHRTQLVSWEEYYKQVEEYGKMVNIQTDGKLFVKELKEMFTEVADKTDSRFKKNDYAKIEKSKIVLKKPPGSIVPENLEAIDELINSRIPVTNILNVIVDIEKWLRISKHFGPISGFKSKLNNPIAHLIITLFCYGCNLGPAETARCIDGLNRKQIGWINAHHITEEKIDKAIVTVINTYNRFFLPKIWGSGKHASADGTKWELYEQNLLSEYHIRYGGYGGIGYYHISDTYIALFSHFIPCGVYEAIFILDGFLKNKSDIQPDTVHGDTHAQNSPVFALSYLLGINLMPRIRNLKDLKFYRPDKKKKFKNIDELFSDTINWDLIETHLSDMLRIALSIKAGKISAATVLKRLGTYSQKNKIYFAFRELGRVMRTIFLLKFIDDPAMRKMIHAATCKSEEFNCFAKWIAFGSNIITENVRHEQRKLIKYNHLLSNMLILHNVEAMTVAINKLISEGYIIEEEVLLAFSPYRTNHLNRFGMFTLDLDRDVAPLKYKIELNPRI